MCTGPQKRMVSIKRAISNKNNRTLNMKLKTENACCSIPIEYGIVVLIKNIFLNKVYCITVTFSFDNNKTFQL